jgi:adenylate kinase
MNADQLRKALTELKGERSATFIIDGHELTVNTAMLVPAEPDNLVKVTDGQSIYIIESERVAWVRIGLGAAVSKA